MNFGQGKIVFNYIFLTYYGFLSSMANNEAIIFFLENNTYIQLCLYLSNPSTNLTSLSVLPLKNSPRSIYASW
jgi:hypothetical protein